MVATPSTGTITLRRLRVERDRVASPTVSSLVRVLSASHGAAPTACQRIAELSEGMSYPVPYSQQPQLQRR